MAVLGEAKMVLGPVDRCLDVEMKVLTQRNGSKSLDLCRPPMIAPYAATHPPAAAAKLAKPSLNNC